MKTRDITVEALAGGPAGPAGETKPALLMVCECGCEGFCVYAIDGDDLHLQCIECGVSYCRGEPGSKGCGFSVPAMKCRVCGCTAAKPCVTAAGEPCSWVEPYLCSACAEREVAVHATNEVLVQGPCELMLTIADMQALESLPVASVRIPGLECFYALSALQLSLRHPAFPDKIRLPIMRLAGALQSHVGATANLAAVAEAGWDPNFDVPAERRIIAP